MVKRAANCNCCSIRCVLVCVCWCVRDVKCKKNFYSLKLGNVFSVFVFDLFISQEKIRFCERITTTFVCKYLLIYLSNQFREIWNEMQSNQTLNWIEKCKRSEEPINKWLICGENKFIAYAPCMGRICACVKLIIRSENKTKQNKNRTYYFIESTHTCTSTPNLLFNNIVY